MLDLIFVLIPLIIVFFAIIAVQNLSPKFDKTFYRDKWKEIEMMSKAGETYAHHAVTEADKLFAAALKRLHFRGETTADRMRSAASSLKNNEDVWEAHKLRNKLVHDASFKVKSRDVKRALASYHRALKTLGAL